MATDDFFKEVERLKEQLEPPSEKPDFYLPFSWNVKDARGAVLDILNSYMHKTRLRKYQNLAQHQGVPRIVADGDSWFNHPLLDDIVDHLYAKGLAVNCFSAAGDTLAFMAQRFEFFNSLAQEKPICLLWSGGGNDLLAPAVLENLLDAIVPGRVNEDYLDALMAQLETNIRLMLEKVRGADVPVFMHGYDYIQPRANGLNWVYPVMVRKGVSDEITQFQLTARIIDAFNEKLAVLQKEFAGQFYHVDLRGSLVKESDWFDEIHPNSKSFLLMTDKLLRRVFSVLKI